MKIKNNFGIRFGIDNNTFKLSFKEGVVPEENKVKCIKEMSELLYDDRNLTDEIAYEFYSNIFTDDYKRVFDKYGFTNGITVIMPTKINNEHLKNSGHYHLLNEGQEIPNMECYEILEGKAAFLLQKAKNFDKPEEELKVEDCVVVIMEEGDKLIVPPFYAHVAVNIGEGPMLFGNLASPCPLNYEPIQKHKGMFAYVLDVQGERLLLQNHNYKNLPNIRVIHAKESEKFGITRNKSLNEAFIENPEKFNYIEHPKEYIDEIEALLEVES